MRLPSCAEDPLEEGVATHSSTLAWRIPWTEEPGGLQFVGSQRLRHDWRTEHLCMVSKCSVFKETAKQFSRMMVSFYTLISHMWVTRFSVFTSICCQHCFHFCCCTGGPSNDNSLASQLASLPWLVMLTHLSRAACHLCILFDFGLQPFVCDFWEPMPFKKNRLTFQSSFRFTAK